MATRTVVDLVRAFEDSMEFLDEDDQYGGPDLETLWWHTEAGPLYWLYRLEERQKARLGSDTYFALRGRSPEGLASAGLVWLRGMVVHHNWDFHVIEIDEVEIGGGHVGIKQPNGSLRWDPIPTRMLEITYPSWQRLDALPSHSPDKNGRDEAYRDHVGGQALSLPLRAALGFQMALGSD